MKCCRIVVTLGITGGFLAAALTARRAEAITFGQPDTENRFSNVGAIIVASGPPTFEYPFVIGSGVLIHPRVLLTAGHVTNSMQEQLDSGLFQIDDGRVSFGVDAFDAATWLEMAAIVTHPGFLPRTPAPDSGTQDIGVVILKQPIGLPCATLACEGLLNDLRDAGLLVNQGTHERFLTVGYGATTTFPPAELLPIDGLRRFAFPEYRGLEHDDWIILNQNPAAGNSGFAAGDSGGPLYWQAPDGELIVVALNSRSDAAGFLSLYRGFRIDTHSALTFIDLVIELVEAGVFN